MIAPCRNRCKCGSLAAALVAIWAGALGMAAFLALVDIWRSGVCRAGRATGCRGPVRKTRSRGRSLWLWRWCWLRPHGSQRWSEKPRMKEKVMKEQINSKSVDRSRLKLLVVLAAAGASGACIHPSDFPAPKRDFTDDSRNGLSGISLDAGAKVAAAKVAAAVPTDHHDPQAPDFSRGRGQRFCCRAPGWMCHSGNARAGSCAGNHQADQSR